MRMAYASAASLQAVRINPNVSAAATGDYVAKGGDWSPAEEVTGATSRRSSRSSMTNYQIGDTCDRDLWLVSARIWVISSSADLPLSWMF